MKRICVFVFYDKAGIVDDYKFYLLSSLREVISDLIIVINGKITEKFLSRLYEYTDHIYIRENRGYDGGAYKDILTGRFECFSWEYWDEIILMNDTFYGPLFSWTNIFWEMEKEEFDFWGLSRCAGLKLWEGSVLTEHIQGYFIAVNKKMFLSQEWGLFWRTMEYPRTYLEAVKNFENYFTTYFIDRGFRFSTWLDKNGGQMYMKENDSPYMKFPYDIVKYCNFPIIKYRALSVTKYKNMIRLLDYIGEKTNYDKALILKHIKRLDTERRMRPFGITELKKFVESHQKIYIFGHGVYGKGLKEYFQIKGWKVEGFIVSSPREKEEKGIEEIILKENDGVIVALANVEEVRNVLKKRFNEDQMLYAKV